ncbi:MAG: two-component system, chemotaxis family, protein-glutamate methylesterase/glutaminase [Acidobacteriota bacterium]|nr:two-component system, chemotaxis family, protein-glutamate methylesterase/glutaminase [Acidobacteriota bacterium]
MAFEIVVIGASYGGLSALQILLSELSPEFPLPVVIVQHRRKDGDDGLCEYLRKRSRLPFIEPNDKEKVEPGCVYLAPRDYHLLIEKSIFALSTESPVGFARPSIDVLFESAADVYHERIIGVILTGANRDGARGLAKIKSFGGMALVQDPESAESPAMPEAAISATAVDRILPLPEIAPFLNKLCHPTSRLLHAR